jgi:hypothetical protein
MENTYTYTARSAENPERVVTFTLRDHSLYVDVGVPLEHAERALQARGAEDDAAAQHVEPWLKPMAVSVMERGLRPFDVGDVYADANNGGLQVTAWVRAGGLRVAPVIFSMAQVDSPQAAQIFAEELEHRRTTVGRPRKLPGLLDYWGSWLVAGFSATVLLAAWLRKRYGEAASRS